MYPRIYVTTNCWLTCGMMNGFAYCKTVVLHTPQKKKNIKITKNLKTRQPTRHLTSWRWISGRIRSAQVFLGFTLGMLHFRPWSEPFITTLYWLNPQMLSIWCGDMVNNHPRPTQSTLITESNPTVTSSLRDKHIRNHI